MGEKRGEEEGSDGRWKPGELAGSSYGSRCNDGKRLFPKSPPSLHSTPHFTPHHTTSPSYLARCDGGWYSRPLELLLLLLLGCPVGCSMEGRVQGHGLDPLEQVGREERVALLDPGRGAGRMGESLAWPAIMRAGCGGCTLSYSPPLPRKAPCPAQGPPRPASGEASLPQAAGPVLPFSFHSPTLLPLASPCFPLLPFTPLSFYPPGPHLRKTRIWLLSVSSWACERHSHNDIY